MTDKIQIDRTVVEQALEALFMYKPMVTGVTFQHGMGAMQALRAALEQPQDHSEQHLEMVPEGWKLVPVEPTTKMIDAARSQSSFPAGVWRAMLAAAPQPPVVERPQGEQEPVAYYVMNGAALFQLFRSKSQADALAYDLQKRHDLSGSPAHFHVVPLYTHPQPKREPLTDAQINGHRLALPYDGEDLPDPWDFKQGVRAAERAHGIGGEA